ncbi:MAG: hypothetical protein QM754_05440 [Tepidisphaeraceae bacterium]
MNLTTRQLRLLKQLLAYHERSPSLGRLLVQLGTRIVGWAILVLLLYVVVPVEQRSEAALLGIGVLTGFLGSGLASIRLFRAGWPVYDALIDWATAKSIQSEADRPGA